MAVQLTFDFYVQSLGFIFQKNRGGGGGGGGATAIAPGPRIMDIGPAIRKLLRLPQVRS